MPAPKPHLAELRAWEANPVTMWIMSQVKQQFHDPSVLLPIKDAESVYMVNYYAGATAVLDKIRRICELK
jgi:hypothetical protein